MRHAPHRTPAEQLAVELGAPAGDRDGTKLVPMLCGRDETGERLLGESGWIYELKLDGVRILADKRGDRVVLGYRKLRDATSSYPEIAEAIAKLGEERVLLDGELVAFDEKGRPDFQRLGTRIQTRGQRARRGAQSVPVVYVVFDVLVVGKRDVTGLPIEARKAILERILAGRESGAGGEGGAGGGLIRLHPVFSDGKELFRQCRAYELEGVVAKRAGSTYRPDDRSADWVKVKCELDADLVVIGWTEGEGKRSRLGALDVGAYDGDRLVARGSVGSGLDEDVIDELLDRLRSLEVPKPLAEGKLRPKRGRHFTRPEIVVSVRYMGITTDGLLRHPVFRGLRHDLAPEDCTLEGVAEPSLLDPREPRRVRLTAPSLVVLPDGTTKGALCKYYEAVAPVLLPYLRGRVCPLLREGAKNAKLWPLPAWTPRWVRTCVVPRGKDELRGAIVEDLDTLLLLLEAGCASLRMTPVHEARPAMADFVALHIHGGEAWLAALRARELVNTTGLAAFAKTDGAGGYDVLVPVGDAPAAAVQALGALFVRLLARDAAEHGAEVERIDAPVAPWAVALPIAPGAHAHASLPVAWDEAEDQSLASSLLDRVRERIAGSAVDDPMRGMLSVPVDFARAVTAIETLIATGAAGAAGSAGPGSSFVHDPRAR